MIKDYSDLQVWQLGRQIVKDIYTVTSIFPDSEKYGLVSQMRRAAVSIPSNIAEGFNRRNQKEYRQFLFVALGSCAELSTQATLSSDLGFLDHIQLQKFDDEIRKLSKMLMSLTQKLVV